MYSHDSPEWTTFSTHGCFAYEMMIFFFINKMKTTVRKRNIRTARKKIGCWVSKSSIISNARMSTRHELPGEQQVQRSSIAVQ